MQTHHIGGAQRTPTPGAYQPWPCLALAVEELQARILRDAETTAEIIAALDAHMAAHPQAGEGAA